MTGMTILGLDNGVSGVWSIHHPDGKVEAFHAPVKKCRDYTKEKHMINRIDVPAVCEILRKLPKDTTRIFMERPFKSPARFKATISGMRAFEATMIALELEGYDECYKVIDSKNWQHVLLKGVKDRKLLKAASRALGMKLYPQFEKLYGAADEGDADGVLIGHWAKQMMAAKEL